MTFIHPVPAPEAGQPIREQGLHGDAALLQTVFSSMAEGVVVHDRTGAVQACNPAALALLDWSEEPLLGRSPLDPSWQVVHEDGSPWPGDTHPAMSALHTGTTQTPAVMGIQTAQAGRRWLLVSAKALWADGPAAPSGALSVFTDVTQRKAAQALELQALELASANRELRATHQHQTQFLQNLTHELRTPLNAVMGFAALLGMGRAAPGTPKFRRYVDQIIDNSRDLLALIDRLLAVSAPDLGLAASEPQAVDIRAAVDAVLAALRQPADKRGVRLVVSIAPGLQAVHTDALRLRQLLLALLDNAIKFSHAGGRVDLRASAPDGSGLQVEIEDQGVGIAPADLNRLFLPFGQLSTGLSKSHPGVGLGLVLAQRLAQGLGGAISVRSQLALGSTFTLRLPPAAPQPA
jgi:PAS domain S-box-containing protein